MAITGLLLILFVIVHLLGNLSIFAGAKAFNSYSHFLISTGPGVIIAEIGLLLIFIIHVIYATAVYLENRAARPEKYKKLKSKGDPSKKTLASVSMIFTGLTLLVFIVLHVKTFKYGPGIAEGYAVSYSAGHQIRDLHRLVVEVFHKPLYVIWYVFALVLMGFHFRHGFWSAFQSLGVAHPKYTQIIYSFAFVLAALLAIGFIFIPVLVYFGGV